MITKQFFIIHDTTVYKALEYRCFAEICFPVKKLFVVYKNFIREKVAIPSAKSIPKSLGTNSLRKFIFPHFLLLE